MDADPVKAIEAANRRARVGSAAFGETYDRAKEVLARVAVVLRKSGPIGEDHGSQIAAMALSMTTMLLDRDAMGEVAEASGFRPFFESEPCRIAWPLAIGAGKTITAASVMRLAADLTRHRSVLHKPLARGVLYSASSVQHLGNMVESLKYMGVPERDIGVFHGYPEATPAPIEESTVGDYPLLLVTQQRLQAITSKPNARDALDALLQFRGKDRLTIWDEAFRSSMADSCELHQLESALLVLKGQIAKEGAIRGGNGEALMSATDSLAVVEMLDAIQVDATEGLTGLRRRGDPSVSAKAFPLPMVRERDVDLLDDVVQSFHRQKLVGPAEALGGLRNMLLAGGLEVALLQGRGGTAASTAILRARLVIDDHLQRLVVLDAAYSKSMISRLDPTLRISDGGLLVERELQPKLFSNVTIRFHRGPSGRGSQSTGLDDKASRNRQIVEQVRRIQAVPLGSPSLVITHKKRPNAPDFKGEIEAELNKSLPGWREVVNGAPRVSVIEWGQHVGLNDWRTCTHAFTVGVLRRVWSGDLVKESYAAARGDEARLAGLDPIWVEANKAAEELMQFIGRTNARATVAGQAGAASVDVYYQESHPSFAGLAPCEGSPLWVCLKEMLPGVVLCSDSEPPLPSGAELVATATAQVLDAMEKGEISSAKLRSLVMERLKEAGTTVSDDVYWAGLKRLQEQNELRAKAGEVCWLKPEPKSRSWRRVDPQAGGS